MTRMKRSACSAFSLVELSIVLVILGLLVGGILAGKSLIHSAEMRSIITEREKIFTATRSFKDKYFAIPGDMPNATQFWGQSATLPMPFTCIAVTDSMTCNGNGNGVLEDNTSPNFGVTFVNESGFFLQQLDKAKMLEGITSPYMSYPSKMNRVSWYMWSIPNIAAPFFQGEYGNTISLSGGGSQFSSEDGWNLDTKVDDGKPATGRLVTLTGCTDTAVWTNMAANYKLDTPVVGCNMYFRQQF